ncbi:MAG: 3-ketoacyl-ACP reductase [Thermoguttaceae bacterium]
MSIAVVTGSSRGIGKGIADILEANHYTVVHSATREIVEGCPNYIRCDVSSKEDREHLLDEVLRRFGRVDVLVNNAGVAPEIRLDLLETTEESFDRLIRINLKSTFFMSQLFANQMIKQGGDGCKIINIASISSYTSSIFRGEYCISKAGISMVTQLFADRLASDGIGVFEIRPGIIETDMTSAVREKYEKMIADGLTPIPRLGSPKDVADAVLACCSGLLDFCPGQILNVDGGFHIRRL